MKLHHEHRGKPHRPTVAFLHGFMGNSSDWDKVTGQLEDRFSTLAIDLPGHGRSYVAPDASFPGMEQTAALVIDALDDAELEHVSLVGYSMGGRVALHLALSHPDRVDRLVIESASPGIADEHERAQRRTRDEALAHDLETGDFEAFLRRWYDQPLFASLREDPARLEKVIARRLQGDPRQLARSLRAIGTGCQQSLWEALPGLAVPVLTVVGERDSKFRGIAQAMAERAPNMKVQVVPDCGHNAHLEDPDRFCNAVAAFLSAT
ncbi:MAG: 2-succinyl-6-hydroxy-2,4-cyclohexadiene-1-carboxylate synthase [bacterium]|nr:2-succinyl-6-hydroxy-2,4-cyclohexadiene-1-carboxylate synthase [bacterium]